MKKVQLENILLFKPMNGYLAYIRKGVTYSRFKAIASVSKDNKVDSIGLYTYTNFKPLKKFDSIEKKILGEKKYNKGNPEDLYFVYYIYQPLYLINPLPLDKPVRGIRYSTDEETYAIKKEIIKALAKLHNVNYLDVFWNWGEYPELYSESIQLDFQDVLFDLEKSGELYDYQKIESDKEKSECKPVITGQTRLI